MRRGEGAGGRGQFSWPNGIRTPPGGAASQATANLASYFPFWADLLSLTSTISPDLYKPRVGIRSFSQKWFFGQGSIAHGWHKEYLPQRSFGRLSLMRAGRTRCCEHSLAPKSAPSIRISTAEKLAIRRCRLHPICVTKPVPGPEINCFCR